MIGAPTSPGKRRACAPTASARLPRSACHSGRAARCGRQASCHGAPAKLPAWLSEADIDFYAGEFRRSGFRGPLNYYRNVDRNWELMAPFADVLVTVPALYVAGDRDMVVSFPGMDQLLANLRHF